MTTKAYMWGWFAYLLGSVGVLFVLWYITRPFMTSVRLPLRAVSAAFLLTPWSVSPEHGQLAPAWVAALFDGLFQEEMSSWRAGGPLLAMVVDEERVSTGADSTSPCPACVCVSRVCVFARAWCTHHYHHHHYDRNCTHHGKLQQHDVFSS